MIHFNTNLIIFYVDNPQQSKAFYGELLGIEPIENSDTFVLFELSQGNKLGLWSANAVSPSSEKTSQCIELAFEVESRAEVDFLYEVLKQKKVTISQAPTKLDFGYALTVQDPDGHRLRFYRLEHEA